MTLQVKTATGRYGNDFEHQRVDGGIRLIAHCSECGETEVVKLNKRSPTCQQAFAERLFRKEGWSLGSTRKKDKCPACLTARKSIEEFAPGMLDADTAASIEAIRKTHFSEEERFITDYIRNHLRRNAQGRMVYLTGYSDGRMLADLSEDYPHLTINIVRSLRVANFGEARARRIEKPATDAERIAQLEEQVVQMGIAYEEEKRQRLELTRRFDGLAELVEMYVGPRGRSRRS